MRAPPLASFTRRTTCARITCEDARRQPRRRPSNEHPLGGALEGLRAATKTHASFATAIQLRLVESPRSGRVRLRELVGAPESRDLRAVTAAVAVRRFIYG